MDIGNHEADLRRVFLGPVVEGSPASFMLSAVPGTPVRGREWGREETEKMVFDDGFHGITLLPFPDGEQCNVLVAGWWGAGKSTLVNEVFGNDAAEVGSSASAVTAGYIYIYFFFFAFLVIWFCGLCVVNQSIDVAVLRRSLITFREMCVTPRLPPAMHGTQVHPVHGGRHGTRCDFWPDRLPRLYRQ